MDAVQRLGREQWGLAVARFTVTGASERGWTSWLTAAVDPRVAGVAPMVIDMLNMRAQIELQRQTFGGLSGEIKDYGGIWLPERIDSPTRRGLGGVVGPDRHPGRARRPQPIP